MLKAIHRDREADPIRGLYPRIMGGEEVVVEYWADKDLTDYEKIPLLEPGGIDEFFTREVLPYTPDAWIDASYTKIGYEISFNQHFYKPTPMRPLEDILADIVFLQREREATMAKITGQMPALTPRQPDND